jgi:hypothetical protein
LAAPASAQTIPPPGESRLDSKLLLRALIELNIARKNLLSYPEGHHQVGASAQRAFRHLRALLDQCGNVSIGVLREGIVIAGEHLEPGNPVLRDLAAALRERRVARVDIDHRICPEDTLALLRLIAGAPADPAADPEAEAPKAAELRSVRVHFIDYSLLHHEELPAGNRALPEARSIWHDFVRLIGSGTLTESSSGKVLDDDPDPTPEEIARFVNRRAEIDPGPLQSYEQAIQNHLQRIGSTPILENAKPEIRARFRKFIESLNPKLRMQFLSVTFDQFQRHAARPGAEAAFGDLHYAVVIEMLIQANADGKEISPTLINLLRKMAAAEATASAGAGPEALERLAGDLEHLRALAPSGGLLRPEAYAAYVAPDYDATLQALIPNQRGADEPAAQALDTAGHLESLSAESLARRLGDAFLGLLKQAAAPELFGEHARNLTLVAQDLARCGEHARLLAILRFFRSRADGGPPEGTAEVARKCLEELRRPGIINAVLEHIGKSAPAASPVEVELVTVLGPAAAAEALGRFLSRRHPAILEILKALAASFPQKVSQELSRRLRGVDPAQFDDLAAVIARLSPERIEGLLAPFLDHADRRIRQEALAALVRQRHPGALGRLEALLGSRNPAEVSAAAGLVVKYGVREMVPPMTRILDRRFLFFRTDLDRAEKLIAAMARVADPFPRDELRRLLLRKISTHPRRLRRIRDTLNVSANRRAPVAPPAVRRPPEKTPGA